MNKRKRNHIGHISNGVSDKVYVVATVKNSDGTYDCVGRYGRRNGNMKEQIKAKGVTKFAAEAAADKLVKSKFHRAKDSYVDIDSPEYLGVLTRNDVWLSSYLEPERSEVVSALKAAKQILPDEGVPWRDFYPEVGIESGRIIEKRREARVPTVEDEVVCVNNAGLEDQFDFGVEYILVSGRLGEDFIVVLDKYNEKREVFSDRFMTVYEANFAGIINEAALV